MVDMTDDDDFQLLTRRGRLLIHYWKSVCWRCFDYWLVHGISHIPITPQLLEGVFAFLVLRATRTLGGFGAAQFLDDIVNCLGTRFNREGAGRATEAAIALAFFI